MTALKRPSTNRATIGGLLIAAALSLLMSPASEAQTRQTELDGTPIDDPVYRSFESNWRKYAKSVAEIEGGFVVLPTYDRRHESSRNISTSQAMSQLKVEREERSGNLVRKRVAFPDRADAQAFSRALPELAIGEYGWVASAEIVKIIDREQMIVKELWLIDGQAVGTEYEKDEAKSARENGGQPNRELLNFNYAQRIAMMQQQQDRDQGFGREFRLIGFDTRGLRVGDRWQGLNSEGFKVAVAYWEEPEPDEEDEQKRNRRRGNEARLVLTEVDDTMRQTVNIKAFKELLAERGMTVQAFVELIRTLRENDRRNADDRTLNALLPPRLNLDE